MRLEGVVLDKHSDAAAAVGRTWGDLSDEIATAGCQCSGFCSYQSYTHSCGRSIDDEPPIVCRRPSRWRKHTRAERRNRGVQVSAAQSDRHSGNDAGKATTRESWCHRCAPWRCPAAGWWLRQWSRRRRRRRRARGSSSAAPPRGVLSCPARRRRYAKAAARQVRDRLGCQARARLAYYRNVTVGISAVALRKDPSPSFCALSVVSGSSKLPSADRYLVQAAPARADAGVKAPPRRSIAGCLVAALPARSLRNTVGGAAETSGPCRRMYLGTPSIRAGSRQCTLESRAGDGR